MRKCLLLLLKVLKGKKLNSKYLPTRKWIVNQVTLTAGLLTMWVVSGTWDQEESLALITLGATALTTYFIPNNPDNANSP